MFRNVLPGPLDRAAEDTATERSDEERKEGPGVMMWNRNVW